MANVDGGSMPRRVKGTGGAWTEAGKPAHRQEQALKVVRDNSILGLARREAKKCKEKKVEISATSGVPSERLLWWLLLLGDIDKEKKSNYNKMTPLRKEMKKMEQHKGQKKVEPCENPCSDPCKELKSVKEDIEKLKDRRKEVVKKVEEQFKLKTTKHLPEYKTVENCTQCKTYRDGGRHGKCEDCCQMLRNAWEKICTTGNLSDIFLIARGTGGDEVAGPGSQPGIPVDERAKDGSKGILPGKSRPRCELVGDGAPPGSEKRRKFHDGPGSSRNFADGEGVEPTSGGGSMNVMSSDWFEPGSRSGDNVGIQSPRSFDPGRIELTDLEEPSMKDLTDLFLLDEPLSENSEGANDIEEKMEDDEDDEDGENDSSEEKDGEADDCGEDDDHDDKDGDDSHGDGGGDKSGGNGGDGGDDSDEDADDDTGGGGMNGSNTGAVEGDSAGHPRDGHTSDSGAEAGCVGFDCVPYETPDTEVARDEDRYPTRNGAVSSQGITSSAPYSDSYLPTRLVDPAVVDTFNLAAMIAGYTTVFRPSDESPGTARPPASSAGSSPTLGPEPAGEPTYAGGTREYRVQPHPHQPQGGRRDPLRASASASSPLEYPLSRSDPHDEEVLDSEGASRNEDTGTASPRFHRLVVIDSTNDLRITDRMTDLRTTDPILYIYVVAPTPPA